MMRTKMMMIAPVASLPLAGPNVQELTTHTTTTSMSPQATLRNRFSLLMSLLSVTITIIITDLRGVPLRFMQVARHSKTWNQERPDIPPPALQ